MKPSGRQPSNSGSRQQQEEGMGEDCRAWNFHLQGRCRSQLQRLRSPLLLSVQLTVAICGSKSTVRNL